MAYFTNIGFFRGPYLVRDTTSAIDILEAPDKMVPIGTGIPVGSDGDGVVLRRVTVHGAEVPGLWVVIDREFRPAR